ncbi:hypothetical protein NFJ02_09g139460 [Pycnococcus provasolii]
MDDDAPQTPPKVEPAAKRATETPAKRTRALFEFPSSARSLFADGTAKRSCTRASAAAAAAAASAVASTPTSEVEKSIATYVQAAYGLSSRSAMSAAQKFFRDTQVAEKLRLACMGGR